MNLFDLLKIIMFAFISVLRLRSFLFSDFCIIGDPKLLFSKRIFLEKEKNTCFLPV